MGQLYRLDFRNGKSYVGISFNRASRRFLDHRYTAMKSELILYRAWRKHGAPTLKVLAVIENSLLHEAERKAIAIYKTQSPHGYNMTAGGEGVTGLKHSLVTRAKMSVRQQSLSPEVKAQRTAKIVASRRGVPPSIETRAKISAAHLGKSLSLDHREKLRALKLNPSPEFRAKLSAAARLRGISPETRLKINASLKGHVKTPEHQAKITAALQNISDETRAKRSTGIKRSWLLRSRSFSPEVRAKMSAAHKGKPRGPFTPERKESLRIAMSRPEVRAKISKALLGRKFTPEHRAKISEYRKKYYADIRVKALALKGA